MKKITRKNEVLFNTTKGAALTEAELINTNGGGQGFNLWGWLPKSLRKTATILMPLPTLITGGKEGFESAWR